MPGGNVFTIDDGLGRLGWSYTKRRGRKAGGYKKKMCGPKKCRYGFRKKSCRCLKRPRRRR